MVCGLRCSWLRSGFGSGGFSAVYALAHAGLRGVCWVRRVVRSRVAASCAVLLYLALTLAFFARRLRGGSQTTRGRRRPFRPNSRSLRLKGWKLATPSDALDRGDWWAPYRDKKLDFLMRQVEVSNQTVAAQAAAYEEARAVIREAQASPVSDLDRELQLYPHADAGQAPVSGGSGFSSGLGLGGGGSGRRHLHDDRHAATVRQLGPRRLGQGAPPDRGQHLRRASERRRSRQRQAVRAGNACHRLFQSARGGLACAICSTGRSRNTSERCSIVQNQFKAGYSVTQRRRGHRPGAGRDHASAGDQYRRAARAVRARHRHADRPAARRTDDRAA